MCDSAMLVCYYNIIILLYCIWQTIWCAVSVNRIPHTFVGEKLEKKNSFTSSFWSNDMNKIIYCNIISSFLPCIGPTEIK